MFKPKKPNYSDSVYDIHRAALNGDKQTVERLCEISENVAEQLNRQLEYPIFSALSLPSKDRTTLKIDKIAIFRYLAQKKAADPSYLLHQNTEGETVFHIIARNGFNELIYEVMQQAPSIEFIPRQDGNYPIHVAVLNGQLDVVQKLLSRPGVAEQKDANDNLPLHLAAAFGTRDMTQACLDAYPQGINQSNIHSQTPLDLAKQGNTSDVRD